MNSNDDSESHQNNLMYYNQMLDKSSIRRKQKETPQKRPKSFASQKVDFSDYLIAPEGYESIVYPLYFVLIPYIVGALFLFFFIAGADYTAFKLLDTSAFLIVWMIGYEIVGTALLIGIFIAFLKYDDRPSHTRPF